MVAKRETVLGLMAKGQVGRAARRINSNGVASMETPATEAALRAKYIDRRRDLPESVSKGQCLDNLEGLRDALLDLEPGVLAGSGGMKGVFGLPGPGVGFWGNGLPPGVWDGVLDCFFPSMVLQSLEYCCHSPALQD